MIYIFMLYFVQGNHLQILKTVLTISGKRRISVLYSNQFPANVPVGHLKEQLIKFLKENTLKI